MAWIILQVILVFSIFAGAISSCTMKVNDSEKTMKQSWTEKGLAHEANSEFKLAVASFSEAISNSPENPIAWKLRGAAYYRLNEFQQAVSDLDEAISLDPTSPDAYLYRGNAYGEMDMYTKAIEDFDKARNLRDGGYFDNLNQAYNSIINRDFLEALGRATAAINERPRDPIPHTYKGICLYELGKFPEALSAYSKATSIDPDNAELLFNRGLVHLATRKFDMAILDFTKALAIDPTFKNSYEHRAQAYDELGLNDKAASDRKASNTNK